MNCERCQGLFLADQYNVLAGVDLREYVMWRCVNCGNILDPQIMKHRTLQKYHMPIATPVHESVAMFSQAVVDNG